MVFVINSFFLLMSDASYIIFLWFTQVFMRHHHELNVGCPIPNAWMLFERELSLHQRVRGFYVIISGLRKKKKRLVSRVAD